MKGGAEEVRMLGKERGAKGAGEEGDLGGVGRDPIKCNF